MIIAGLPAKKDHNGQGGPVVSFMMILSKSTAYGIRALSYLSYHRDRLCGLNEIADQLQIPPVYLGKILGELRRHRLLTSVKGIHGGYRLEEDPERITFLDVYNILEPNPYFDRCILAHGVCRPETACEVHESWRDLREQMIAFLQQRKISDLSSLQREHVVPRKGPVEDQQHAMISEGVANGESNNGKNNQ